MTVATPLSAQQVVDALKREGVAVQEYSNWRTHNRNHVGSFGPVNGVVIHHTVSSADDSSVALCYNGHAKLPGPLCHGVGRNDGRIALVGHGRANHAGLGDDDVLQAVINETPLPADNEANTDGNRHFYGLEIVNLGNGTDTYPWVQYVAAVKWATAHCRAHGWNERSVIGHKEWQPGKIDPHGPVIGPDGRVTNFDMNRFRADVKAALALPAGKWQGSTQEEEDVALSADDKAWIKAEIKAAVWGDGNVPASRPPFDNGDYETNGFWGLGYSIQTGVEAGRKALAKVEALESGGVDLDALAEKVADLLAVRLSS